MKYYYIVVAVALLVISLIWVFNHVNPWISIALSVVVASLSIPFFNYIKNKHNK